MTEIDRPELTHGLWMTSCAAACDNGLSVPLGALDTPKQRGIWLHAWPSKPDASLQPYLRLPGSQHLRIMPDGLWLHFSPDPADAF
jgi:hypothetical protein